MQLLIEQWQWGESHVGNEQRCAFTTSVPETQPRDGSLTQRADDQPLQIHLGFPHMLLTYSTAADRWRLKLHRLKYTYQHKPSGTAGEWVFLKGTDWSKLWQLIGTKAVIMWDISCHSIRFLKTIKGSLQVPVFHGPFSFRCECVYPWWDRFQRRHKTKSYLDSLGRLLLLVFAPQCFPNL